MKTFRFLACLFLLPAISGCAMSDAVFAVFGDHYSDGGYTRADRKYHFEQQLEASSYASSLP
jgi:hypothetical protein